MALSERTGWPAMAARMSGEVVTGVGTVGSMTGDGIGSSPVAGSGVTSGPGSGWISSGRRSTSWSFTKIAIIPAWIPYWAAGLNGSTEATTMRPEPSSTARRTPDSIRATTGVSTPSAIATAASTMLARSIQALLMRLLTMPPR